MENQNNQGEQSPESNSIDAQVEELKAFVKASQNEFLEAMHQHLTAAKESADQISNIKSLAEKQLNELHEIIRELTAAKDAKEKAIEVQANAQDLHNKIDALFKRASGLKNEIEAHYFAIEGYEQEAENGEKQRISGLKDKLASTYSSLETQVQSLEEKTKQDYKATVSDLSTLKQEEASALEEFKKTWSSNLETLRTDIRKLLPDALTAGLSHAYESRRAQEEVAAQKHKETFTKAIAAMALFAFIPVAISTYEFVVGGKEIDALIRNVPNLVSFILPLYIPVLWIAYFSNKQMNLSKRLIEEYAHKESVTKTFEGLSRQIENISNKDVADDLRNKLLYNLLEVSSENPGKLITDYNKSDHPLMDALDKSVKLTNAVEKVARIPGFNKLAQRLGTQNEKILKDQGEKAEKGLSMVPEGQPKE